MNPGLSADEPIFRRIQQWLKDLINLNRRNRLLYFQHTRSSTLEITHPELSALLARLEAQSSSGFSFYPPEAAPQQTLSHVAPLPSIRLPRPDEIVTSARDPHTMARTLRNLARRSKQEYLDRGLWVLYLGLGFLDWFEDPGEESEKVSSPILLVPVELRQDGRAEPYRLSRTEDDASVNLALSAKLEHDFGIAMPTLDDLEESSFQAFLDKVRAAVSDHSAWVVSERVVLGAFSFHKEVIYRDLLDNQELIASHPTVSALVHGPGEGRDLGFSPIQEGDLDDAFPPEQSAAILDADASQRQAIAAALTGHTFVMDGPPGTGKSQTIANIIAELLGRGRTVLFVSEKIAALDVVRSKLEEAGIDDFALELHSHKATRKEVAQSLGRALYRQVRVRRVCSPSDLATLALRRRELTAYACAMNEVRQPFERSLHSVLGEIASLQGHPHVKPIRVDSEKLTAERCARVKDAGSSLARAWGPVSRGEDFVWRGVAEADPSQEKRAELVSEVIAARDDLMELQSLAGRLSDALQLSMPATVESAKSLAAIQDLLPAPLGVFQNWLVANSLKLHHDRVRELKDSHSSLRDIEADLLKSAGGGWEALDPASVPGIRRELTTIENALVVLLPKDGATASTLRAQATALAAAGQLLNELLAGGRSLAALLAVSGVEVTLARMRAWARLGLLAASPHKPDASWLDEGRLPAIKEALTVLVQLAGDYRRRRDELTDVFDESILGLDLEGLCVRFETVHRGLRVLLPGHWRDCRLVALHCRSRRVTKVERSGLRAALEWKRTALKLAAAEESAPPSAGAVGYSRNRGDLDAILKALVVADEALSLASAEVPSHELRRQVSRAGSPEPQLIRTAQKVQEACERWEKGVPAEIRNPLESSEEGSTQLLIGRIEQVVGAMARLAGLVGLVRLASGAEPTLAQAIELLQRKARHEYIEAALRRSGQGDSALLGAAYQGRATDWQAVDEGLRWAEAVRDLLGGRVPEAVAACLLGAAPAVGAVRVVVQRYEAHVKELVSAFEPGRANEVSGTLMGELESAEGLLRHLAETVEDVVTWVRHVNAESALRGFGLQEVVETCKARRIGEDHVEGTIRRALLEGWADDCFAKDGRLTTHSASDRDSIVDEFRKLDRDRIAAAAGTVAARCNDRRPTFHAGGAALISREAALKGRHMPIRDLLREAGPVAQALKPCFMMSPLSVSQFLPPTMKFDVVIFDEASQVRPCDAISCIYRGAQLIVAGDQQQLPPTTFFEKEIDDLEEGDEEAAAAFESVLDLCKGCGAIASLPLRWHYRSQHEDLITFSNFWFYDGRLMTFPCARPSGADIGLEAFVVPGVYRRGGARDNPIEAAKVVERILFHRQNHPNLSLGVVAFSEAQEDCIEAEIDRRSKQEPELSGLATNDRLSTFFVKNLETVQGDERDIIILSVGYGRDETGRFLATLGPLSKSGGERRLNVATTRARRRLEIVTSVTHHDFGQEAKSDGVRCLRSYLEYALRHEDRVAALRPPDGLGSPLPESPFEEEVMRVVSSWGYDVVPQVGCARFRIDLAVRHPRDPLQFAIGIECDGAMYHSSRVARDRDRLRGEVLRRLGWTRLHRIWGPAWYRSRGEQEARLRKAIEDAVLAAEDSAEPPGQKAERGTVDVVTVRLSDSPAWAFPYTCAVLPAVQPQFELHEAGARDEIRRLVAEIVRLEAPVAEKRVLRRIREAWGVGRAGRRIQENFKSIIQGMQDRGELVRDLDGFLYIRGAKWTIRRPVAGDETTFRDIDEIFSAELKYAAQWLVRDAMAISREELAERLARVFGWERNGHRIAGRIAEIVNGLLKEGKLKLADGVLTFVASVPTT